MRLQLILGLLAVAAVPARADTAFGSKLQVYTDNDHTTVVSPVVTAEADVTTDTNVSIGYLVDAVSSASVDVVSQASPKTFHDTRHQVSLGMSHRFDTITPRIGYSLSMEDDYLSHTLSLNATDELNDKNTQLGIGYGVSINRVGRAEDDNFSRPLTVHHVAASWTQTMSPKVAGQLTYEISYSDGYQASPYRFVPIRQAADAVPEFWVPETDPDTRWRHALVVGANAAVGDASSLQGDYRIYRDTWGITSHTLGARYFMSLAKHVELRLRERFYTQNAASFYQSVYMAPARYIVYDRELSPMWSETLGAKLTVGFGDRVEAELKLDGFYYSYADFVPLRSRTGANVGLGVSLAY
ncbi:MAG TPA: DUF3570 domain-containing protein [Kofleriaceae bacterium]|nr:DUF3570 domain-containing protein [Kofleriaceae bacterium]